MTLKRSLQEKGAHDRKKGHYKKRDNMTVKNGHYKKKVNMIVKKVSTRKGCT